LPLNFSYGFSEGQFGHILLYAFLLWNFSTSNDCNSAEIKGRFHSIFCKVVRSIIQKLQAADCSQLHSAQRKILPFPEDKSTLVTMCNAS